MKEKNDDEEANKRNELSEPLVKEEKPKNILKKNYFKVQEFLRRIILKKIQSI